MKDGKRGRDLPKRQGPEGDPEEIANYDPEAGLSNVKFTPKPGKPVCPTCQGRKVVTTKYFVTLRDGTTELVSGRTDCPDCT